MEKDIIFQLKEYMKVLKKGKWIILITTLLCTIAGVLFNIYISKTVYQTNTSLIAVDSLENSDRSQINDIIDYQNITKTFSGIATSKAVAEKASENLQKDISLSEIQNSINVSIEDKTPMLIITVQGTTPERVFRIANSVSDAFKEEALNIYPSIKFQTVDKPYLPKIPINQGKQHNIIISFFIGLLGSICIVFLMDYTDITIKSTEEIEKYLGLPVIGNISKVIIPYKPRSRRAKEYRILKTNIQLLSIDSKVQAIMVASAGRQEGRSVIASNLAMTLADSGKKTILLDCDYKNPSICNILGILNEKGLSDILMDKIKYCEKDYITMQENLYVITSGSKTANYEELLSSSKLNKFILMLKESFNYIIIDTPPVNLTVDAQVISKYTDGCVFVVAEHTIDRKSVILAKETLEKSGVNIIGVVFNKIDVEFNKCLKSNRKGKQKTKIKLGEAYENIGSE